MKAAVMIMMGSRLYFQPQSYILAAIHDIKELQNGKGTSSDIDNGKINFLIKLYNTKYELLFTVTDIGMNRCTVEIEIAGDVRNKEDKILREYALLDATLTANTQIELMKSKQSAGQAEGI